MGRALFFFMRNAKNERKFEFFVDKNAQGEYYKYSN